MRSHILIGVIKYNEMDVYINSLAIVLLLTPFDFDKTQDIPIPFG